MLLRFLQRRSPLALVTRGLYVCLASLLLTLFVPGYLAYRHNVFYAEDVSKKIMGPEGARLADFEAKKKLLSQQIEANVSNLAAYAGIGQQKDFEFNKSLLAERAAALDALKQPIFPVGFFLSGTMLLWPALYTSLGCLLICFRTDHFLIDPKRRWRHCLLAGVTLYIFYEWPLWVRNFVLGRHARTVYYFTNFDIDPRSFYIQEAIILGLCLLVATVWVRWAEFANLIDIKRESSFSTSESYLNVEMVLKFQRHFQEWVLSSIVLGLGFVYFTSFYWSLVVTYHDVRYLLSAILAHSMWILTWIFLSLPLVRCWICIRRRRLVAMDRLLKASQGLPREGEQKTFEALDKLEAIAGVRLSVAGGGAVISLFLPILQLVFHK